MSTSRRVKQSEGATGSRRSGPPEDKGGNGASSTKSFSGGSPARTLPPEEFLKNPPQPEISPFAGKAVELLSVRDKAVPSNSSKQSEQLQTKLRRTSLSRMHTRIEKETAERDQAGISHDHMTRKTP